MPLIHQFRHTEHRDGTPGLIVIPGLEPFACIEPHWRGNEPFDSCIPAGDYDLVWHGSPKYPISYALVGGTVSHRQDSRFQRYACLWHKANWAEQLSGCTAPGMYHTHMASSRLGHRSPRLAVAYSGKAMRLIHARIGKAEGWRLRIHNPPHVV